MTEFAGNFVWDTAKPNGQPRRCLDVSRAPREFGFEAKTKRMDTSSPLPIFTGAPPASSTYKNSRVVR